MKPHILAVDDQKSIQVLVKSALKENFDVTTVGTGAEALTIISSQRPDLIILDIMLPDMSGYEICSEIMRLSDPPPVIFLSASKGVNAKVTSYNLGGAVYLEKPFDVEELRAVVKSTLKRGSLKTSLRIGNIELDLASQTLRCEEEECALTFSESRVLLRLIEHQGDIVSRNDLLDSLDVNENSSDRVIDNHISSLRKKLHKSTHEIQAIYGQGYKLRKRQ